MNNLGGNGETCYLLRLFYLPRPESEKNNGKVKREYEFEKAIILPAGTRHETYYAEKLDELYRDSENKPVGIQLIHKGSGEFAVSFGNTSYELNCDRKVCHSPEKIEEAISYISQVMKDKHYQIMPVNGQKQPTGSRA